MMTSATLLMIGGISGQGRRPLLDVLLQEMPPIREGDFRALVAPLWQIVWPEKFKAGHIDKYDGSSNLEEFIQVYHMVIEFA
jgi:hypothetical protein